MIILIAGASHTGKTLAAQKLLEKYKYPYLSIDHLKMGLIRAGYTNLTAMSDDSELTAYLWPVVREMIKTAIENKSGWSLRTIKRIACLIRYIQHTPTVVGFHLQNADALKEVLKPQYNNRCITHIIVI